MIDIRKIRPGESVAVEEKIAIHIPPGFGVAGGSVVVVAGRLANMGKTFAFEGNGKCRVSAECALCLEPVAVELVYLINESFAEAEAATDEEISFSDKMIDLLPAIERNLFTNIPMKVVCSRSCAGLCLKCGKNLNDGECDCKTEGNEHFQQLSRFFDD